MRRFLAPLACLTLLLPPPALAQSTATEDISDSLSPIEGDVYYNELGGVTLQVPSDATIMAEGKLQEIGREGQARAEERSSRVREAKKKGHESTTLFRLHLKPSDATTIGILPGITCWQETLRQDQAVAPEKVLSNLRKAMEQASNIQYRDEIFTKQIDTITFTFQLGQFSARKGDHEFTGVQEQHVIVLPDRLLGFALSYNTAQEGNRLRNILWSLKLDDHGDNGDLGGDE